MDNLYSVVLPDSIIDNLTLNDAELIAEDFVSRDYRQYGRRANWINGVCYEYIPTLKYGKMIVVSIEKHERIEL